MLLLFFIFITINYFFAQTILSAGDVAVIGFRTNNNTDAGNDALKLVTLVDLECNTKFIVTDNNWRNSVPIGWACDDDEFGFEIICNSSIAAGSIFYIDVSAAGATANCSGGSITKTALGNPWGTDYGLSSGGDNLYILQGTRAASTFIFAIKNSAFANNSCSNKDQAGVPTGLTLGTSAVAMPSSQDQWHFNCITNTGAKAVIRTAICNPANWVSTAGQSWNNSSGIFSVTGAAVPYGVLAVSGAGCGCLANCNLVYSGGSANCGTGVGGDCSGGYQNMTKNITVPGGCTFLVTATMRNRGNGCTASGADGNCQTCDVVKVDVFGGSKIFQQGASNSTLTDSYTLSGPGTIVVSGKANRADEIITYGISVSPCNCTLALLPVELADFYARKKDKAVEITWLTLSEKSNDYFVVERSADTEYWETINVIGGRGFSTTPYNYSVFDSSPLNGTSYYRLKQVDRNERFTYSKIVSIDTEVKEYKLIKCINLLGEEVDENASGLVIFIYDNGEVKKVYK